MVKSPRIRHSKPRRDPVTIDLEASEVETPSAAAKDAEASVAGTGPVGDNMDKVATKDTDEPPTPEKAQPARQDPQTETAASATGAAAQDAVRSFPGEAAAKHAEAAKSAPSKPTPGAAAPGGDSPAASSAFGRDAGKASATTSSGPTVPPKPSASPRSPAAEPRRSGASAVIAGILGAVVALAGAGALQATGVLPSLGGAPGQVAALQDEIAALRTRVEALPSAGGASDGLAQRVNELAIAIEEARAEFSTAAGGQADPAAMQTLNERFAALEAAVEALPSGEGDAAPVDLAPLNERIAALEASVAEAGRTAADAANTATDAAASVQTVGERIDQLEQIIAGLSTRLEEQAAQPQAALAIAASALKAAIDRGEPFTTELETFVAVAPETAEIEPLRALAATGVPSRAQIAAEFDDAASAMLAAGRTADPNAGFLDKLMTSAQSLVQVRPVGEVVGEGAPEAIARMEVAVDKGDYATALREYELLPEAVKAAGADYSAKLRARLAADDLMDKVLAAALKA